MVSTRANVHMNIRGLSTKTACGSDYRSSSSGVSSTKKGGGGGWWGAFFRLEAIYVYSIPRPLAFICCTAGPQSPHRAVLVSCDVRLAHKHPCTLTRIYPLGRKTYPRVLEQNEAPPGDRRNTHNGTCARAGRFFPCGGKKTRDQNHHRWFVPKGNVAALPNQCATPVIYGAPYVSRQNTDNRNIQDYHPLHGTAREG